MKFRKKPVVVEAVRWVPDADGKQTYGWPKGFSRCEPFPVSAVTLELFIPTLEGEMTAKPGDWIIKGVRGEFYPCKPDIFAETYEPVMDTAVGRNEDIP